MEVHGIGVVKPDAADGVHNGTHRVPFHNHPEIRLKAHQLGNLFVEGLNALLPLVVVSIDRVQFFHVPGDVDHGIPGQRHHRCLLVGHIVGGQHHGIGVSTAAGIQANHQHRVKVLALPLSVGFGTGAVPPVLLVLQNTIQVRAHKQAIFHRVCHQNHRQYHKNGNQEFLKAGKTALLFSLAPFSSGIRILSLSTMSLIPVIHS